MTATTQALLRYWRSCVADSALGKGRFRQADLRAFTRLSGQDLRDGSLPPEQIESLFADRPGFPLALPVRLRPRLFARQVSHGAAQGGGLPELVAPIVTEAQLTREGRLLPGRTVIARDVLEPLGAGAFAIGSLADLDRFLTRNGFGEGEGGWPDYLAYCTRLMQAVAEDWPDGDDGYDDTDTGLLEVAEGASAAARNILALYDGLIRDTPDAPLLHRLARVEPMPITPPLPRPYVLADRLGHANDRFPLADHQRDVLAHLARAKHGDILAVNGPPGTGKTTMLLSAIAGAWVRAALDRGDPPVTIAASTNNQAVTNIIDAFGKDFATGQGPFAGRWLPGIGSFGLFLASASREAEASAKYQTENFLPRIESEDYVLRAHAVYLARARAAFPGQPIDTVEAAVALLHARMVAEAARLAGADRAWADLQEVEAALTGELGPDPQAVLADREAERARAEGAVLAETRLDALWEAHIAGESTLLALFSFLPPVARKRLARARVALAGAGHPDLAAQIPSVEACGGLIRDRLRQAREGLEGAKRRMERAKSLMRRAEQARTAWAGVVHPLQPDTDIEAHDRAADCGIRFGLFLLATHYWEGRWLIEMAGILPDLKDEQRRKGRKAVIPRWRRRMMLMPCAVATFATLPGKMTSRQKVDGDFRDEYLYDFIDLLIVDEAGQVLPEIAAPAFALARNALVIGDRQQLKPISNPPSALDIGNLVESGVLPAHPGEAQIRAVMAAGIASSTGSAMAAAQNACALRPEAELDRGLYLFDHHRCLDEIIGYCNALCYKGKLRPLRGGTPEDAPLPPVGYLQVDGIALHAGGSRFNLQEARTIAAWLAENRGMLEARYHKRLEEIAGIVTPFGRQVRALNEACAAQGIAVGGAEGMTIGTVHSLQGAERPVVLFSPVYSKHADGGFIDDSPSMLNVSVSRAKDSFLVFGDMDVFSGAPPGSPRALLADYLSAVGTELVFTPAPREDLQPEGGTHVILRDAAGHDAFLLRVLASDARKYLIVSPWIVLPTMEREGIMDALRDAVARGAEVELFTDPALNAQRGEDGAARLAAAGAALEGIGVRLWLVRQVHSKIVAADDALLCIGSYNWLSADRHGAYARHETSFVYTGPQVRQEIRIITGDLRKRVVE